MNQPNLPRENKVEEPIVISETPKTSISTNQLNEFMLGSRKFTWVPFVIILLCVLLPFFDIYSGDSRIASVSGMQSILGAEVNTWSSDELFAMAGGWLVLFCFLTAIVGLLLSLGKIAGGYLATAICSGIGFFLMFVTKTTVDSTLLSDSGGSLEVGYAFGFLLSIFLFFLSAVGNGYFQFLETKQTANSVEK